MTPWRFSFLEGKLLRLHEKKFSFGLVVVIVAKVLRELRLVNHLLQVVLHQRALLVAPVVGLVLVGLQGDERIVVGIAERAPGNKPIGLCLPDLFTVFSTHLKILHLPCILVKYRKWLPYLSQVIFFT